MMRLTFKSGVFCAVMTRSELAQDLELRHKRSRRSLAASCDSM